MAKDVEGVIAAYKNVWNSDSMDDRTLRDPCLVSLPWRDELFKPERYEKLNNIYPFLSTFC